MGRPLTSKTDLHLIEFEMLRSDVHFRDGMTYFMDGPLAVLTLLCKQLSNKPRFCICLVSYKTQPTVL